MVYLHNDKEQFAEAINLTVYKSGLPEEVVEKDYYVTMILRCLSEKLPFIVFKGGTSLSKCHRVIKRFSEDIDISVDISLSQGQKKKVKNAIIEVVDKLGLCILNLDDTRSRRDYNRYVIGYKSIAANDNLLVSPSVLIETSYTTVSFPTVVLSVTNYIGEMMQAEAPEAIKEYELEPFEMKVQDLNRTLVDKVFAVCDYYLQDNVRQHSRHIYDIYKLLDIVPQDDAFRQLVAEVRNVRKKYAICLSAQDNVDVPNVLCEIISKDVYKADYQNLTEGLLEEEVAYETAIDALKQISKNCMFE